MSKREDVPEDAHETYAELERVRRDIATLSNQLGPRFVSLYAQLEKATKREAALLEQIAARAVSSN